MGEDRRLADLSARVAELESQLADKQRELDTRRSQARVLENVITNIPYFVFWKDRECVFEGCNEAFARVAGTTTTDIVGKTDYDMPWRREEAEFFRSVDFEVMGSELPRLDFEEPQRQLDGTERILLTSKVPILDGDEVTGILGIFTDITKRKQMERELERAKEAAEASDRAKSDFLAAMSHELRTPLTLILSPLALLIDNAHGRLGDVPAELLETLQLVYRNAGRLKSLVDDVLDYTKLAADQYTVNWQSTDVHRLLSDVVADARPAANVADVTLSLAPAPATLGSIPVDVRMFEKIALNLIGNAIKFTEPRGHIEVSLAHDGDALVLLVRDSGIGISAADLPSLFDRFKQVDSSAARRRGGTGLGLALVKEFARAMGGDASVESELGVGSQFTVRLPIIDREVAPDHRPATDIIDERLPSNRSSLEYPDDAGQVDTATAGANTAARASGPVVAPGERPRLLVVEDNDDMRAYLGQLLGRDYAIDSAHNGKDALERIRARMPDIVVSDLMMPEMDGLELLTTIKRSSDLQHLPVLLLTARAGHHDSIVGLDAGADDYLSKPFSGAELLARVRAAERLVRARANLERSHRLATLGRLVGELSHEIYNPSNVIFNNIEPMHQYLADIRELFAAYEAIEHQLPDGGRALKAMREELDVEFVLDDFDETIRGIGVSIERIIGVQDDTRSYLQGKTPPLAIGSVDACVERAVAEVCEQPLDDIEVQMSLGQVPACVLNERQLQQVVVNLVANAVDATSPGGHIAVDTVYVDGEIRISVTDDGPGVPHEHAARIFEPFFTTKPISRGMGLGLAVCQKIIQHHNGTLSLDLEYTDGARFIIAIPVSNDIDDTNGALGTESGREEGL